jgi:hypothetical protein
VDTQLALAGGLYETLRMQSQGITSLTSAYQNPAETVARLTVSDRQTAGTFNAETNRPEFVANGLQFVDSAPLNSPANKGQVASVEASQLSRALTIAEMQVKDDLSEVDTTCPCLLGRADLAFINTGYQVKFMKGTAPDVSVQTPGAVTDFDHPIAPKTTLTSEQTLGRVEQFLADLYESLDGVHQEYEDTIRGKLIKGPSREALISSNEVTVSPSPFSPPFSAPNRAQGGDPAALALQGSTAVHDISQSWKTFGDNLRVQPKRAELAREIDTAQKKLQSLDGEEKRLRALQSSGSVLIGGKSISDRLATLQTERSQTTQQLNNATAKLRQLESQQ